MDNLAQAVWMWQVEIGIAIAAMACVYLYHKGFWLWRNGEDISLIFILGVSLSIITALFFFLRDRIHWFGNRYALFFLLLYCWCALGTLFVASRQTHAFKLFIGLASQAGIVYGLYRWV